MSPVINKVTDAIFHYIPKAKLTGEYIIFKIRHESELSKQIEVIIDEKEDPEFNVNIEKLKSHLIEKNWYQTSKLNEYYYGKIVNHQIYVKIDKDHEYEILIELKKYDRTLFHVNNLQIDKNNNITPIYCETGISPNEYIYFATNDIKNKRISLVRSIDDITSSIEKKYNFQKMITIGGYLIKQGWIVDPLIKKKILNINPKNKRRKNKSSKETNENNENEICAICRDSIDKHRAVILKCDHLYHIKCLRTQLLDIGANSSRCSLCRKEIID